jgi:PKD repeat protein
MTNRCVGLAVAAALAAGLATCPQAAHAQQCAGPQVTAPGGRCTDACTLPTDSCQPTGTPIARSSSGHYFDVPSYFTPYTPPTIPLLGQSYEYVCHICAPNRDPIYCTLNTFHGLLDWEQQNRNNVIRLQAIFNHSPGLSDPSQYGCNVPFQHEQPFFRDATQSKWDLRKIDNLHNNNGSANNYLSNLEAVVCRAYNNHIIVEVTLFNPYDGTFTTGPFYTGNTVDGSGFSARQYFVMPQVPSSQQSGRDAQILALQAVVNQLKGYPNVIWEVANEPDFLPKDIRDAGVKPADVFAWEQLMIGYIKQADPGANGKAAHLIQLNGHTVDTFAWTPPPTPPGQPPLPVLAGIDSLHYTTNPDVTFPDQTTIKYYGAISLWQQTDSTIVTGRGSMAIGFNENISVPDVVHNSARADSEVRSEALEFFTQSGALFDGYSVNYAYTPAQCVTNQLRYLADVLIPNGTVSVTWLDALVPGSCSTVPAACSNPPGNSSATGNWCAGLPCYGAPDEGDCQGSGANAYWSSMIAPAAPYLGFITVGHRLLYIHHGVPAGFNHDGYKAISCKIPGAPMRGYHANGFQYSVSVGGTYQEYWLDPATNVVLGHQFRCLNPNQLVGAAVNPTYSQDVLLFIELIQQGNCTADPTLTSSFTYNCNYLYCNFDGSGSTPSNVINSYSWSWGDGTANTTSSTPQVVHNFGAPGTDVVTLTVSDPAGDVGTSSQQLQVTAQPPSPSFVVSCNQLTCSFSAGSSRAGSAAIRIYSWDFGDATSGSGVYPTHTYTEGGSYAVTLTLTDDYGLMASARQTISVVGQPPAASFTFSCLMLGCSFDGSGSAPGSLPIASYAWQFGDGGTASGTAATSSHSYAATGAYTVTLTVTDTSGLTATASQPVQASAAPLTANESYFSLPPCRLLDTRNTGGPLGDGQSRVVTAAGACGIPATAKAISVVVTAVSPTNPGKIALIAGNQTFVPSLPPFSLNFVPQTSSRSNDEIVPLAANGTLAMGATFGGAGGQVQVLLDVDGYFSEDTAAAAGAVGPLGYQPVTNCRLADTRPSSSPIVAGTVRSFTAQGVCGIPAGAAVASIRTGVSAPATGGGFTVYSSNLASPPPTTTINFVSGIGILRNETRVLLASATPDFSVVYTTTGAAGSSAYAFFDTNGYFQAGAPLKYHPIASCRVYSGTLAGGVTQLVQVQGNCGVPAGAAAVFARLGVSGPTATGDMTLSAAGTAPPPVSTIKFDAGEAGLSLGTIVPLAAGAPGANDLAIFNNVPSSATASLVLDIHGYLTSEATAGTPPAASFAFTCTGLACRFDASASSAGSSPIVSYSWSFGDAASAFGVTSSHGYPSPASYTVGRYPVTLTVIDSASRQSSVVRMVSVNGDSALPAESYFALPPCRVLDTRNAPNTVLTSGQARIVQIAGPTSPCGIPSSAKAVSLTVTAVSPTGGGILDLYPGDKTPTVTSIDFDPARSPRATNIIELLALNGAGTMGVLPSVAGSPGQVHLVLDVDGYFSEDALPASGAQGPLGYQTIAPCRLVDTRTTNTPLVSGTVSNFTIQGNCGIPAGAVTAALNVVSVAPSNGGFFILYPSSLSAPPNVSNLNWLAGISAIANGARPTLAATTPDLKVVFSSVAPGNTAHLVVDTMGYFKSGAPYKYHPVAECRAAYTAGPGEGTPSIAAGTTRSFQIQGNCGVPVGAKAAFIKTSLNPLTTNAAGLLLLFPAGGSPNGTSFLNWDAGETWMSGGAIVTLSSNIPDISVASNLNADLIIKVFGYFQ